MKGHWGRLIALIGVLASMLVVNFVSADLYLALISITIIVLPPANWTVFAILLWAHRQSPEIESLTDRVDDQLTLALASTVGSLIALFTLGRLIGIITFSIGSLLTVGLGFILVSISMPGVTFLRTWRDVWLPMVIRKRDAAARGEFEEEQQSGMDAMEGRLQQSINENTQISQEASDHAQEAFKEANSVNQKIAAQGEVLVQQGEDLARLAAGESEG